MAFDTSASSENLGSPGFASRQVATRYVADNLSDGPRGEAVEGKELVDALDCADLRVVAGDREPEGAGSWVEILTENREKPSSLAIDEMIGARFRSLFFLRKTKCEEDLLDILKADSQYECKCISPEQLIMIFQKLIFFDLHYTRPERNIIAP